MHDTTTAYGQQSIVQPLPWQQDTWALLARAYDNNVLSHAYLIDAGQGVGAEQFADALASALLCEREGLVACGECETCQLLKAGTHPDYFRVGLDDSAVLKIDQIRAAILFASGTASRGGYRCISVNPAEAMNVNAANALLKLLEEPGERTVLILVSYSTHSVPATVRSRCQHVSLHINDHHRSSVQGYFTEQNIDTVFATPYYLNRPLLAYKESKAGQPPSQPLVEGIFQELIAHKVESSAFYSLVQTVDPLLLVDHLYLACLNAVRSQQAVTAERLYTAIDALTEYKKTLLSGGTLNPALFYQHWSSQLMAKNMEGRLWA